MKIQRTLLAAVISAAMMPPLALGDEFYESQLRLGKTSLAANRPIDAIDQLRIAAFGTMDQPVLLTEALARLALAYNAANQPEPMNKTVARFLEVEGRFRMYANAALETESRDHFNALLVKTLPPATLGAYPNLASLVKPPEESPKRPARRKAAAPKPAPPEPAPVVVEARPAAEEPRPVETKPVETKPVEARPLRPDTRRAQGRAAPTNLPPSTTSVSADLAEPRRLIQAGRPGEAERILYEIVQQQPERRDARLLLLEAACLYGDWEIALAQLQLVQPFRAGEDMSSFYAAVTLFESGEVRASKSLLAAIRPRLISRPYIEFYSDKINAAKP